MVGATETNSKPCQRSKMELFSKKVNGSQPLNIFAKHSISDVWQGFEYASQQL